VQRAVALAPPGGTVEPEHLSPDMTVPETGAPAMPAGKLALKSGQTLAGLVDDVERDLISEMLSHHSGNISETARSLGLTRRGLYLKLRRLGLETPVFAYTK
jgi:DNA-binding NtrC family response regulator